MSMLYDNILYLCKKENLLPCHLCDRVGISRNVMQRFKSNPDSNITVETITKIANYFEVDPEKIQNEDLNEYDKKNEDPMNIKIYNNILELMQKKNITHAQFCKGAGVAFSLMGDLKTGRKHGMRNQTAMKIAHYFGVSMDEIIPNIIEDAAADEAFKIIRNADDILFAYIHEMYARDELQRLFRIANKSTKEAVELAADMLEQYLED